MEWMTAASLDSIDFSAQRQTPNQRGQGQPQVLVIGNDKFALVSVPGNSNLSLF